MFRRTIEHLLERRLTLIDLPEEGPEHIGLPMTPPDMKRRFYLNTEEAGLETYKGSRNELELDNEGVNPPREVKRNEITPQRVIISRKEGRQGEVINITDLKELKQQEVIVPGAVSCMICYSSLPQSELQTVLKCSHAFCAECQTEYILEQINSNKVLLLIVFALNSFRQLT